jgi:hypothetical protein
MRARRRGVPAEFAVIGHPAGGETQWDWVELPGPPPSWGQGKHAHLLVGALAHSGGWRGVLAESEEQPYLIASLHGVCGRLGGVTREWRFDRMSTVCHPESGDVTASFAEAAKYYGAIVRICPSRSGWRKGVVEKASHSAAQRWWRTLPDEVTPAQAQARLDAWCARHGDARGRALRTGCAPTSSGPTPSARPPPPGPPGDRRAAGLPRLRHRVHLDPRGAPARSSAAPGASTAGTPPTASPAAAAARPRPRRPAPGRAGDRRRPADDSRADDHRRDRARTRRARRHPGMPALPPARRARRLARPPGREHHDTTTTRRHNT